MKILSAKTHGIIDYLLVLFLAASPTLFNMEGALSTVTYGLAALHLLVTITTDFELGLVKLIPFRVHGLLEIVVSLALAILAVWFYNNGYAAGFNYYIALAVAIMIVFILTDFKTLPNKRR